MGGRFYHWRERPIESSEGESEREYASGNAERDKRDQ